MAGSLPPGHNGDQVDFVAALQQMAHDGVSAFMDGHHPAVLLVHLVALLFRAHLHPGDGVDQQLLVDLLFPCAGCQNGCLVHDVFQIRAGGIGHPLGDVVQVHMLVQGLALAVYLQDGYPAVLVRIVHRHLPVKPAGTHQRRIQDIPPVGGGHHNDAFVHGKAVHFHQQLVQGLLTFIVSAAQACAPVTAHRVDLIYKDDCGSHFLRLVKKISDPAGAHAHKHLHKVAAADGEEGNTRLSCHGLRQQGFACSGRSHQQHTLGNACAQFRVAPGILQEVHHLLEFFLLLIRAGHIREGNLVLGGILHARAALAEVHHFAAAARLGPDHHEPDHAHDNQHDQVRQEIIPPRDAHRGPVFQVKGQLVHRHLVDGNTLFVRFNLADCLQEILTDRGLEIIVPFREILVTDDGLLVYAHQGIVAYRDAAYFIVLDLFQQLRVLDPAAYGLVQAAVQQERDNHNGGKQDEISDHASGWSSGQKSLLLKGNFLW